jgi:GLPGLI family protein
MKRILIVFVGLFTISLTTQAQKKSGAIQFETTMDFVAMASANGAQLSDEMKARMPKAVKSNFELLFNATNASYMPVEDAEDSNGAGGGGGMARMMGRFGGAGGLREYYYSFADQKLVEVFDLMDTTYVMQSKLTVAAPAQMNFGNRGGNNNGTTTSTQGGTKTTTTSAVVYLPEPPTMEIVKTDETKKILNFNCNKAIVKTIRKAKVLGEDKNIIDETAVWYTTELGFNFSPNPNLWTEGTVLALENKGSTTIAKGIEYRNVSAKDVTAPKKALPITADEVKVKMEAMMKRFSGGGTRQGGAPARVVIN